LCPWYMVQGAGGMGKDKRQKVKSKGNGVRQLDWALLR